MPPPPCCYLACQFLMLPCREFADARIATLIAFPFWSSPFHLGGSSYYHSKVSVCCTKLGNKEQHLDVAALTSLMPSAVSIKEITWDTCETGESIEVNFRQCFPFEGEQTVIRALLRARGNRLAVLFIEPSQGARTVLQSSISELICEQGCHILKGHSMRHNILSRWKSSGILTHFFGIQ